MKFLVKLITFVFLFLEILGTSQIFVFQEHLEDNCFIIRNDKIINFRCQDLVNKIYIT